MEDRKLVLSVLRGDQGAFDTLVQQNIGLVMHMVTPLVKDQSDKEELIQDVFVKVYQKLESFQYKSKLSTWIGQIAYRMAINFLKKKKVILGNEDLDSIEFKLGQEDLRVEQKDAALFIQILLEQLPPSYNTILTLYYLEEMSYAEIVEITGMPEGTVKNYLFRAKKKLKELSAPLMEKEIGLL